MTKLCAALGVLLGVSILVNGLTFAELSKLRSKQPGAPTAKSRTDSAAAPSATDGPVAADNSEILKELRALRSEVASIREGRGSATGGTHSNGHNPPGVTDTNDLPPSVTGDPAVAKLLAEQEALNKLWKDLQKVSGLQKSLGEEKYRQLVTKMTAEFLGLDDAHKSGFETAAGQMISELDAAAKAMQEAYKTMTYDQKDPNSYQRQYAEVTKRYNEARKTAESRLDPYLTTSGRHQQFKQNLQTWGWYLNPNQWGDYSQWGATPGMGGTDDQ